MAGWVHCGGPAESPILAVSSGALPTADALRALTLLAAPLLEDGSFCMASYGMNDVKNGQKIIVDGYPCTIVDTEYVKPGKGQAFTRVKYRNLKTGRTVEMTMKSTDTVEAADVMDTDMEFLYSDGEFWHFMHPDTHEQIAADRNAVADAAKWLKGNEVCIVTLWNGAPLTVTPPVFVELEITETDPGVRGDTSGGGGKPAKLETGAVVRVPLFVGQGEKIKVDTRSGEYMSRVK
jgi:elongation factor P